MVPNIFEQQTDSLDTTDRAARDRTTNMNRELFLNIFAGEAVFLYKRKNKFWITFV